MKNSTLMNPFAIFLCRLQGACKYKKVADYRWPLQKHGSHIQKHCCYWIISSTLLSRTTLFRPGYYTQETVLGFFLIAGHIPHTQYVRRLGHLRVDGSPATRYAYNASDRAGPTTAPTRSPWWL